MAELRESDLLGAGAICAVNQALRHGRKKEESNSLEIRRLESRQCLEAEFVAVSLETATSLKTKQTLSGADRQIVAPLIVKRIRQKFVPTERDALPKNFSTAPIGGKSSDFLETPIAASFSKQFFTIKMVVVNFFCQDQPFRSDVRSVVDDRSASRKKLSSVNLEIEDRETDILEVRESNTLYLLSEPYVYAVLLEEHLFFHFCRSILKTLISQKNHQQ